MKVLIAGDWHSNLHEEAVFLAFQQLGHQPLRFAWHSYFKPNHSWRLLTTPFLKFQNKYMLGPLVDKLNQELLNQVKIEQPDLLFVYRGSHIYPDTLKQIHQVSPQTILIGYNNDDPFSPQYPAWQWRHFLAGVPTYDLVLAYRTHNLNEFKAAGAKRVELLRSWFIPDINHPVDLSEEELKEYKCDVVFIGHHENDSRLECLELIVKKDWHLNLFGHNYGWNYALKNSPTLKHKLPLKLVWGEDYNKALSGAKVALCFLSKLNRDTYTRRCFEIPACGTLLLSEYSDDLAGLFKPGVEADYFRSPTEMIQKIELYLSDDLLRNRVATAGQQQAIQGGHDVVSRMRQVLIWAENINKEKL
jgi:spore maturation protein CgeB